MVSHQLQVERWTGKVRRPETDVLPTVPRHQLYKPIRYEKKCYSDMRSKAYMSQINLQHGTTTDRGEQEEWKTKTRQRRVFRRRTPTQHAMFLEYALLQQHFQLSSDCDTQTNFDFSMIICLDYSVSSIVSVK